MSAAQEGRGPAGGVGEDTHNGEEGKAFQVVVLVSDPSLRIACWLGSHRLEEQSRRGPCFPHPMF